MVFTGDPKDWNAIGSLPGQLRCQLDGSKRLIEHVGGPAKQHRLLSGDNGAGAGTEALQILLHFGPSTPSLILALENLRYLRATVRRIVGSSCELV